MPENEVRGWLQNKIHGLCESNMWHSTDTPTMINRLRAIAEEAELRLSNPNWPESNE